jgi:hypothetical protein
MSLTSIDHLSINSAPVDLVTLRFGRHTQDLRMISYPLPSAKGARYEPKTFYLCHIHRASYARHLSFTNARVCCPVCAIDSRSASPVTARRAIAPAAYGADKPDCASDTDAGGNKRSHNHNAYPDRAPHFGLESQFCGHSDLNFDGHRVGHAELGRWHDGHRARIP